MADEITTEETSADPNVQTGAPGTDGAPGAEDGTSPAGDGKPPTTGAAPKFDLDAAVKEDRAWRQTRKAQETEIETRRKAVEEEAKRLAPLVPMLEHMPKVDQAAVHKAIAALAAGDKIAAAEALFGLDPKFVAALADHVGERYVPSEVPVAEQIAAALKADKEAQAKADADAKKQKEDEDKATYETSLENYCTTLGRLLKTDASYAAKFPLCTALNHRLDMDRLRAEVTRRANAGENVAIEEVLPMFEKEFADDIGKTPFGKKPDPVDTFDERFALEEVAFFKDEPAPAKKVTTVHARDGGQRPQVSTPTARSGMDEIDGELARLEAAFQARERQF
jgi:hypothetical protein